MIWDNQIQRRFSSTSHFRLLNQVRGELRSQPLNRDPQTHTLSIEAKPSPSYNLRDSKRHSYTQISMNSDISEKYESEIESNKRSFRDRLNSIDMK